MDFQHRYLYFNKILLSFLGLWPNQSKTEKLIRRTIILIVWSGHLFPTIRRMIIIWGDEDEMINSFVILVAFTLTFSKFFNTIHKDKKMGHFLNKIKSDWHVWSDEPELKIIEKFAEEGRKLSLFYAIVHYCSVASYLSFTLSPQFLDFVMPMPNGTREKKYILPEDFGVDPEKYFNLIFFYAMIGIYINFTITASVDSMYVVYVQHACGIFSAIGQRLENLIFDSKFIDKKCSRKNESREVFFCVQQHKSVLKYAEDLEDTYTIYFFFLILINVIILVFNGVQIVIKMGNLDDVFKFANYSILLVVHLLYNSIPGQKLIDHSEMVSQSAYNSCWYQATKSTKKSLLLILMRSSKPSKISAGKYYVLSLKNFIMVMKTAMSYFTVLLSTR